MPLTRPTANSSKEKRAEEQTRTQPEERSNLEDPAPTPVDETGLAALSHMLDDLSINNPPAGALHPTDKGKQRLHLGAGPQGETQSVSAPEQLSKMLSSEESRVGTYMGRDEEKDRLESLGFEVKGSSTGGYSEWKTESAHLVDYAVAFHYPHLRDDSSKNGASENEAKKAKDLGPAYTEKGSLHQKHVGSHYNEKAKGFDKNEHAWVSPAKYREDAKFALRNMEAKDHYTGLPTNLSNTIQMNLLDFAHVQTHYINGGHNLGLYEDSSEVEAADNSFKRTIRANPPIFHINDNKIQIRRSGAIPAVSNIQPAVRSIEPPVTSIQDARIVGRRLTSQEQAELILAREIVNNRRYPNQKSVESAAGDFLPEHEFNEKQALWKESDELLELQQTAAQHAAGTNEAQRAFEKHIRELERKLAERAEEANYPEFAGRQTPRLRKIALEPTRQAAEEDALDMASALENNAPNRRQAVLQIRQAATQQAAENAGAQRAFEDRVGMLRRVRVDRDADDPHMTSDPGVLAAEEDAYQVAIGIESNARNPEEAALRIQQTAARLAAESNRAQRTFENYARDLEGRTAAHEEEERYPLPAGWRRDDDQTKRKCERELGPSRKHAAEEASRKITEIEFQAKRDRGVVGRETIQEIQTAATQQTEENNRAQRQFEDRIRTLEKGISERSGQTSKQISSNVTNENVRRSSSSSSTLDDRPRVPRLGRG